jgi:hypothetical protein
VPTYAELAGVVRDDDRAVEQPVVADAAPERPLGRDLDRVGGDLKPGEAERLEKRLPGGPVGEVLGGVRGERVDNRFREVMCPHVPECVVVDDVVVVADTQDRREVPAALVRRQLFRSARRRGASQSAACSALPGALTLFALNRHLNEELPLDLRATSFGRLELEQALELYDYDLQATNAKNAPDRVKPAPLAAVAVDGEQLRATLAPASWNVIRLASPV